jgi:hypothetical protein
MAGLYALASAEMAVIPNLVEEDVDLVRNLLLSPRCGEFAVNVGKKLFLEREKVVVGNSLLEKTLDLVETLRISGETLRTNLIPKFAGLSDKLPFLRIGSISLVAGRA